MRIPGFKFVVEEELQEYDLQDTTVVVDGDSYFNNSYKNSHLPIVFGTESEAYADYLRKCLMKYKEANVKCYFVFNGGQSILEKNYNMDSVRQRYQTIFVEDVIQQVIDELGFEYVVCEYESKTECIALAQKLCCPIISFNIEYCFSGVDYIPCNKNTSIERGIFKLNNFLKRFKITEEVLTMFVVMIDEEIFSQNKLTDLFTTVKMPSKKIKSLLASLRKSNRDQILERIFNDISVTDQRKFLDAEEKVKSFIIQKPIGGIPTNYLINNNKLDFKPKSDELWFEKGVALKYIAIPYVNIYHHKILINSNAYDDSKQGPSLYISMEIIKYAYDLLTNFMGGKIDLWYQKFIAPPKQEDKQLQRRQNQAPVTVFAPEYSDAVLSIDCSIRKPDYNASTCVFENGWENVKEKGLFQHFLLETLQFFNFDTLEKAPEDARLLIVALMYFARKKSVDVGYEVFSILLSYVTLNIVLKETNVKNKSVKLTEMSRPIMDTIFDKKLVTKADCEIAGTILKDFFDFPEFERSSTLKKKKSIIKYSFLHPLLEFQHCLQHLNYLNRLCGVPFKPTIYSETYNGTLVYNILMYIKDSDDLKVIKKKLNAAPTVLAFLHGMMEIYEGLMY